MMILDALDAIQWACILIQIGTETEITTYIDRFKTLTRKNANRLPNIKALWDTFAWEIAVHMRTSATFGQITSDLLSDPIQLADILSQPFTKKQKGKKGDGKGKYKTKKGNTWQNNTWYNNRQNHNQWRNNTYNQQYQAFPPAPPCLTATAAPYNQYNNEKGKENRKASTTTNTKDTKARVKASTRDSAARR